MASTSYAKYSGISGGSSGSSGITALTGDVSASGTGSVAATVNSVGGSLAAAVNTATIAANAATNANTASTIVERDVNGNFVTNNISYPITSTVSSGGTVTLTVSSNSIQQLTGTSNHIYILPDATTLTPGLSFDFINDSTGIISIKNNLNTLLYTVQAGGRLVTIVTSIVTAGGVWDLQSTLGTSLAAGTAGLLIPSTAVVQFGAGPISGFGNMSLNGDGLSYTILNVATGGTIYFRVSNSTKMSMSPAGVLTTNGHIWAPTAQTITAGGSISSTTAFTQLQAAAPLSTSTSTVITAGTADGQILTVLNVGANTITLKGGGNTVLPGLTDYALTASSSISFVWSGTGWYCTSASVN